MSEQRPLIMCGPSGIGKTTLKNMLVSKYEGYFGFSVSHTTRKPRDGEVDGEEIFSIGTLKPDDTLRLSLIFNLMIILIFTLIFSSKRKID